ncbi:MAG: hypothetical protein ACOCP8_08170 [archaeon]
MKNNDFYDFFGNKLKYGDFLIPIFSDNNDYEVRKLDLKTDENIFMFINPSWVNFNKLKNNNILIAYIHNNNNLNVIFSSGSTFNISEESEELEELCKKISTIEVCSNNFIKLNKKFFKDEGLKNYEYYKNYKEAFNEKFKIELRKEKFKKIKKYE